MDCNCDVEPRRKIVVSLHEIYSTLPSALLLQRGSSGLVRVNITRRLLKLTTDYLWGMHFKFVLKGSAEV